MKLSYQDIMNKLGVGRPLNVYETQPWLTYDGEKGITCEAEVRCNHDQTEVEAELQLMFDTPKEGQRPVEQMCLIKVERQKRLNNQYTVVSCLIKGEEWKGKLYDWETKSCNFFRLCVKEIKADKIPDIDAIEKKEMKDSGNYGSNQGDGSNKAPKINASQLMYDRKGIGAGF
jgi:hypothetical protein